MQIKQELRKKAREKRRQICNKKECDYSICEKLCSLELYKKSEIVLIYVSLDDEVETDEIIKCALSNGKKVAVPFCRNNMGNMDFYLIDSLCDLKIGSFNIREPDINSCRKLCFFENSVIVVPGLCFDKSGNRLGFGKGYYDRFLAKHNFTTIGLCYDEQLVECVPTDKYDRKVDYIITQSTVIKCDNGGKNG